MKMHFIKWSTFACGLFCMLLLTSQLHEAKAQVTLSETFENQTGTPPGWTSVSFFASTVQPCADTRSIRRNFWTSGPTGSLATPSWVSNGQDVSLDFIYKIVDFSAATNPTVPGWGTMDVQYSIDNGVNYTTFHVIDDNNHVTSSTCAPVGLTLAGSNVPAGSDVRIRFNGQWLAGDYYFYLDNISVFQQATEPPACNAALTSPADGATEASASGNLAWSAATGAPTNYNVIVTQVTGGPVEVYNQTLGNVLSTNVGILNYNTTYEVQIIPSNANGPATGCSTYSFTTQSPPPAGTDCISPLVISSLPFMTTDNTANYGDVYSAADVPAFPPTYPQFSTGSVSTAYINGDEAVYSYTATEDGNIEITLSNHGTWVGLWAFKGCPFNELLAYHNATTSATGIGRSITGLPVSAGETIYIVVSTNPTPQSTAYTLNVNTFAFDCPLLNANIGGACDDGNPDTFNDVVDENCNCTGTAITGNMICTGAENIGCGAVVSGSTVGSTVDNAPFCTTGNGTGGGRWYRFFTSEAAETTMSLCNSNYNTRIRVYQGNCDGLTCVVGNLNFTDAACNPNTSRVTFTASANVSYYVLVHGNLAEEGDYVLEVSCSTFDCPSIPGNVGDACDDGDPNTINDQITADCQCLGTPLPSGSTCIDPITIGGLPYTTTDNTINYGDIYSSIDRPAIPPTYPDISSGSGTGSYLNGDEAVYQYTATSASNLEITLADHGTWAGLWVFSGCPFNTTLAYHTDGSAGVGIGRTISPLPVAAGETIYIVVSTFPSPQSIAYTLNVEEFGFDCPILEANFGDACDDGDPTTFGDVITENCLCAGTPYDCIDELANIGDLCSFEGGPGELDENCVCQEIVFDGCTIGTNWQSITTNCDSLVNQFGEVVNAWAPEHTPVNVLSGVLYTFSVVNVINPAELPVAYITITGVDSTILANGANSVEWLSTFDGQVRFYVHQNPDCSGIYSSATSHTRRVDWNCAPVLFDCPALEANIGDACDAAGEPGQIDENCECVALGCQANGGTLEAPANRSFCVGTGTAKGISVTAVGATGTNQRWGLIDSAGDVVDSRGNNSNFNLDIFPAGNYTIRYIRFENDADISGITNISQVSSLTGCFGFSSNNISLFLRDEPIAGDLTALSPTTVCANAGAVTGIQVGLSGFNGENLRYGLTSNALGNQVIATTAGTTSGATFNLNGLAAGIYRVSALAFQQGVSVVGVQFANQLQGCFSLSNLVTVNIEECAGATLESSPNPTASQSFVTFTNPREEYATLEVYDMSGRMVERLFNQVTNPGQEYRLEFNGSSLPNGVYLYRLTTDSEVIVNKFMIAR